MDRAANPFTPGAGLPPPALVGRDEEIDSWITVLGRTSRSLPARPPLLVGLRGVGKTVLLGQLRRLAEESGWLALSFEAQSADPDGEATRRRLARELLATARRLNRPKAPARLREALGSIVSFSARAGVTGIEIGVTRTLGRADSGALDADLRELVEDVSLALQADGKGFAIFCDEVQELDRETMTALLLVQHEAGQRGWPFFFVGAGLPNAPSLLASIRSYAERLFDFRLIGPLPDAQAAAALQHPARQSGAEFTDEALALLVASSGGYPYFLQEYGQAAWNLAPASPIGASDARAAIAYGTAVLDEGFFRIRWERASDTERAVLRAMATLPPGQLETAAIAREVGRDPRGIAAARKSLLAKGLIFAPQRGKLAFAVPGMAQYVARSEED